MTSVRVSVGGRGWLEAKPPTTPSLKKNKCLSFRAKRSEAKNPFKSLINYPVNNDYLYSLTVFSGLKSERLKQDYIRHRNLAIVRI